MDPLLLRNIIEDYQNYNALIMTKDLTISIVVKDRQKISIILYENDDSFSA